MRLCQMWETPVADTDMLRQNRQAEDALRRKREQIRREKERAAEREARERQREQDRQRRERERATREQEREQEKRRAKPEDAYTTLTNSTSFARAVRQALGWDKKITR